MRGFCFPSHYRRAAVAPRAPCGVLALLAICALVPGCAGSLPPVTAADARRAAVSWPDTTLAELEQGRSLYLRKCSGCHNLYPPASHHATDWPNLLAIMTDRAKLEPVAAQQILRYLVVMSGLRKAD